MGFFYVCRGRMLAAPWVRRKFRVLVENAPAFD